jgi:hypothetical protein
MEKVDRSDAGKTETIKLEFFINTEKPDSKCPRYLISLRMYAQRIIVN